MTPYPPHSLHPPRPPEPPRTHGRWLATAILPAIIGAGVALGVARLADNDTANRTVTVAEERTSAEPVTTAATPTDPPPASAGGSDDGAVSVQQIVRDAAPGVVLVEHRQGLGSGFVIDRQGHILTNEHVVDGATKVTVTYSDGTKQDAKVLAEDPTIDLAVLEVDTPPASAKPLPLGQSRDLTVGDPVVAIGNPLGFERTATTGIVSAVKRQICSPNQSAIANAIQTDAAINQGNSGGPLLDRRGRVIGINSQIVSQSGGFEGIGFAVPIDTVRPVADGVIAGGDPQHAWMGIFGDPLTPQLAKDLGVPDTTGVALQRLDDRGPAKKAGLRAVDRNPPKGADIIVQIAGRPIRDFGDLSQEISSRRVGEIVEVTVLRNGKDVRVKLTLQDRPGNLGGSCQ